MKAEDAKIKFDGKEVEPLGESIESDSHYVLTLDETLDLGAELFERGDMKLISAIGALRLELMLARAFKDKTLNANKIEMSKKGQEEVLAILTEEMNKVINCKSFVFRLRFEGEISQDEKESRSFNAARIMISTKTKF